ncbi:hypothetical protein EPUS_04043 [Endocarpon pusillum Z07020]|uniref:Uncharacterized protein n=1 Tax=Endocarpon pusillum (strain Z07020 / HMAS-L-300199) TaxID=1263415 RepID=U1HSA7_ENDPU|nr:uncharacterized protein EPUS_04043 [Endocarpon pusillum Z07020]ERF73420.1 hypothetical protein EPUS_04043 [Endocarpon pusillum Z07020]
MLVSLSQRYENYNKDVAVLSGTGLLESCNEISRKIGKLQLVEAGIALKYEPTPRKQVSRSPIIKPKCQHHVARLKYFFESTPEKTCQIYNLRERFPTLAEKSAKELVDTYKALGGMSFEYALETVRRDLCDLDFEIEGCEDWLEMARDRHLQQLASDMSLNAM